MELSDSRDRARFASELERNFLVIAPAGVGKTTALTERIVNLVRSDRPSLVVVTFTKKAASELRSRVMASLSKNFPSALSRLPSTFFGTIDSFFSLLLKEFGLKIGVPPRLEVGEVGDQRETDLWEDFLENYRAEWMRPPIRQRFLQFHSWEKIARLARQSSPISAEKSIEIPPFPTIDWQNPAWRDSLAMKFHLRFDRWRRAMKRETLTPMDGDDDSLAHIPGPIRDPIRRWLEVVGGILCNDLALSYHHHKIRNGFATFPDIRLCVGRLLDNPDILDQLHRRRYQILLDEAQDTDATAFELLLKLLPPHGEKFGPEDGLFCLVGDPQQSIYLEDSKEFERFASLCDRLLNGSLEKLIFSVTMRCPVAVIERVNETFSKLLTGQNGQATFVEMRPRPGASGGQVFGATFENGTDEDPIRSESLAIADFLMHKSPADLAIESWSQLAILAARRTSLAILHRTLDERGIPSQLRIRNGAFADATLYRWVCGLCRLLTSPADENEAVAILREIFVVSDRDTALFANREVDQPFRFSLLQAEGEHVCSSKLRQLASLWERSRGKENVAILDMLEDELSLLDRVAAIPGENRRDIEDLWTVLREFAEIEEELGHNFYQFADQLAQHFQKKRDTFCQNPQTIQLDTLHGSKGLEWPLVWLPFLNRDHRAHRQDGLIFCSEGDQPRLLFRKGPTHRSDNFAHTNHLQRLFYVGMTRAKKTLILSALKSDRIGPLAPTKFLDLNLDQLEWPTFQPVLEPQFDSPSRLVASNEVWAGPTFATLKNRLASGARRSIHPSRSFSEGDGKSTVYGDWWHETLHYFPFSRPAAMESYTAARLRICPNCTRGDREIHCLIRSNFFQDLCRSGSIFTEFPFYALQDSQTVHGFIDLLHIDPTNGSATIVDWKTEANSWGALFRSHRTQLTHYLAFVKDLPALQNFTIRAGIYATRLGECRLIDWADLHI